MTTLRDRLVKIGVNRDFSGQRETRLQPPEQ
jgi:hypothetical protein